MSTPGRVLELARGELHVREDAANNEDKGGRIKLYRQSIDDPRYDPERGPEPWCADFVSWVFDEAGLALGPHRWAGAKEDCYGFAYTPWLLGWLQEEELFFTGTPERAGMIVMLDLDESGRPDHVGILESWGKEHLVLIEGNVGSFPSGGVKRVKRKRDGKVMGFGDPY